MSSPNADAASRRADATAFAISAGSRTMRIPRPPPPADAFTSTGHPMPAAAPASPSSDEGGSAIPGSTGTPAACTSSRAVSFDPIAAMASGGGPTNTSPASRHRRANSAFSDRKP